MYDNNYTFVVRFFNIPIAPPNFPPTGRKTAGEATFARRTADTCAMRIDLARSVGSRARTLPRGGDARGLVRTVFTAQRQA